MTINQKIIETLTPICPEIVPQIYLGTSDEYIVFKVNTTPTEFADGDAQEEILHIIANYIAPLKKNVLQKRTQIRRALSTIGTAPTEYDLTDDTRQEYVYEFETTGI